MKTDVYYYSGTGNALWASKRLAEELGETDIHSIAKQDGTVRIGNGDALGIVFPVHIWGVPRRVLRFVEQLSIETGAYCFAVAVNGGQVARTLVQLKEAMASKGIVLSSGFEILFPSNYIPWGGPGSKDAVDKRIADADEKIKRIAPLIRERKTLPMEKGPLWQNILFTMFYKFSFSYVPVMDKKFSVDEKCTSCGICAKVCPASNIEMKGGKPAWLHQCEQCLACIQWCPAKAIQYGDKTPAYERYHHPSVKLSEIMASAPGSEG